MIVTETNQS